MFFDLGLDGEVKRSDGSKFTKHDRLHERISKCVGLKTTNKILSVDCDNEKTFQFCCNELDCDLISLDLTKRLNFYLKQDLIKNAVKRGIYFEIPYNDINQHTLANGREIVKHTKGKNIILSSNAWTANELKEPADIINIAYLFGLSNDQALRAITLNCKELLEKVEAKSTLKGMISLKRKEVESTVSQPNKALKSSS